MSTDVYAGQLCATQVGEWIKHPLLDAGLRWWLSDICHSDLYPTVKLICRGVDYGQYPDGRGMPRTVKILRLDPDDVVTFSVR